MPTVSVEVDLSDFSDEDLLDEVNDRNLSLITGHADYGLSAEELLADAMADLMAGCRLQAIDTIRDIIAKAIPPHLFAAYEAAIAGKVSTAICELDHVLEPSPAATATHLPRKVAALKDADEVVA
jgi:hypothetical protein